MTQREVVFLKDGTTYGYKNLAGETAFIYDEDVDYLLANAVIQLVIHHRPQPPKKKGFWAKLLGR